MKQIAKRYWEDHFWRHNAIFLMGSLLIAFLNYLYYPVLARFMNVTDFGEVQALLSIANLMGIVMTAFHIVVITISASQRDDSASVIQQFEHLALLCAISIAGVLALFAHQIGEFFDFDDTLPIIGVGITLVLGVALSFRDSFLHGKKDFLTVSLTGAANAAGRLLFSTLLVIVGWHVFGAIAGILIAQCVVLIYSVQKAKRAGYVTAPRASIFPDFSLLRPEMRYLLSVTVAFFAVTLFYNADVLVVKRFFSPEIAGQYAGISTIAKIVFFATSSFAGVLLASAGQHHSRAHNRRTLYRSFGLVMAVGGTIVVLFTLLPELIVTLMVGEQYLQSAHLLPYLGFMILLVSIINLYFYYLLALRHYVVVPIAALGGVLTITLTVARHDTLETVIQNFLTGCIVTISAIIITEVYHRLRPRQH